MGSRSIVYVGIYALIYQNTILSERIVSRDELPRGVLPSGILKMRKKCPGLKVRFPIVTRFTVIKTCRPSFHPPIIQNSPLRDAPHEPWIGIIRVLKVLKMSNRSRLMCISLLLWKTLVFPRIPSLNLCIGLVRNGDIIFNISSNKIRDTDVGDIFCWRLCDGDIKLFSTFVSDRPSPTKIQPWNS